MQGWSILPFVLAGFGTEPTSAAFRRVCGVVVTAPSCQVHLDPDFGVPPPRTAAGTPKRGAPSRRPVRPAPISGPLNRRAPRPRRGVARVGLRRAVGT